MLLMSLKLTLCPHAEAVSQVSSMMTMCAASAKSKHTASTQVMMEGSARHALILPTALGAPFSCRTITTGTLPLTRTLLSAAPTLLHAGQSQL